MPVNAPSASPGVPSGGGSDAVHAVLARLQGIDGLVTACLVEPDSAFVLDTVVGKPTSDDSAADLTDNGLAAATISAAASDVVQVIGLMTSGLGDPDELEDVTITFGRRHHLITPLPEAGVDGLLVVVTLDRARTNLALARQQLRSLGPLLVQATQPSAIESGHVS